MREYAPKCGRFASRQKVYRCSPAAVPAGSGFAAGAIQIQRSASARLQTPLILEGLLRSLYRRVLEPHPLAHTLLTEQVQSGHCQPGDYSLGAHCCAARERVRRLRSRARPGDLSGTPADREARNSGAAVTVRSAFQSCRSGGRSRCSCYTSDRVLRQIRIARFPL